MKRNLLLLLVLAFLLGLAWKASADPAKPAAITLPAKTEGTLIGYEGFGMRCWLFVNEDGMAKGAGGASCIAWPSAKEFVIFSVVKTEAKSKKDVSMEKYYAKKVDY